MKKEKKLQVFISSTYEDLKEERQAAVQAVLSCGHIPAGMELFSAGDESQINVIRDWIEESDVFLLILGGRYGSIESKSGKSYIHLEYEHAVNSKIPLFAVVLDHEFIENKVKTYGSKMIETDNSDQLKQFRTIVLSKMVKFCKDVKDIKLSIFETLPEFEKRKSIVGWIRSDNQRISSEIADEFARLTKENSDLRNLIQSNPTDKINGSSFEEMEGLLKQHKIGVKKEYGIFKALDEIRLHCEDEKFNALHFFIFCKDKFGLNIYYKYSDRELFSLYNSLGLLQTNDPDQKKFGLSFDGAKFLTRLRLKYPGINKD